MAGPVWWRQKVVLALMTGIATMVLMSSCAPVVKVVEPPQVPEGVEQVVVEAPADAIALTRLDLPAGFQLAAEERSGPEYVALYLRPAALDPGASGGNRLLSVLITTGVYTTTTDAESVYQAASSPTQQVIEDIALVSGNATDVVTQEFEGAVQGADDAEAFRVTFQLMGQSVYEYGHRMRLGNVLAYVVVAAVGEPDEPSHLLEDARNLVQRQIDKIVESAQQAETAAGQ